MADTTAGAQPIEDRNAPGRVRAILAGGIGNLVEWFDWAAYAFMAPIFAVQFFPKTSAAAALLSTFLIFAVGFFARPLGAALIGSYADKFGRRNALALTILLMSGGSLVIGIVPTAATIGLAAPVLLVLARLAQGFSAGGEFGSSATFLVEYAPPRRRAFVGSFQQVSVVGGTLLASAVSAVLTTALPESAMAGWGWRIPFLIGAALGLLGLWLRRTVREPASFTLAGEQGRRERSPLLAAMRRYPREMARVVMVTIAQTLVYYLFVVYLPAYANARTGVPLADALRANTVALVVLVALLPFAGLLSDRFGRRKTMVAAAVGYVVITWPLLSAMGASFTSVLLVHLAGIALYALYGANSCVIMVEQFPAEVRTAGVSLPYALAVALFGGTAPYLSEWLASHDLGSVFLLYVILMNVVGAVVYLTMPETKDKELH